MKGWLSDNVFSRTPFLVKILIDQGVFVTMLVTSAIALLVVYLGTKVKAVRNTFLKVKKKLMWSSILRSQVQTYFPTCVSIFSSFKLMMDVSEETENQSRRLSASP